MTTTAKAIAGLGGLLATATVPSTYLAISSSSSSNSEETTKVDNRKTGTKWLTSSGYKPNKPTFKFQNNLEHGCSENLFSNNKGEFDPKEDKKLYGCAVMNMSLWNTGMRLSDTLDKRKDIDPKWIQFNSEIAIRKGNEGWVINSRFDNLYEVSTHSLAYVLTTYKYEDNKWQKNGEPKLWLDSETSAGDSKVISVRNELMFTSDNKLVIKGPGGTWFEGSDWAYQFSDSQATVKKLSKTKNWSGVWIDNENQESSSWIFENIELYIDNKKYSKVFCKGGENECFQSSSVSQKISTRNPGNANTWSNAAQGSYAKEEIKDTIKAIEELISKLQDSKGSWEKLESVCEVEGEPDEKQKELLKMYCANGKVAS